MVEESKSQFYVEPKKVLETKIEDLVGSKFVMKRGQTEREKEETTLTEEASLAELQDTLYVGLFFSAESCVPCKTMLRPLKNFYTDVNMEKKQFEVIFVPVD